MKEIDKQMRQDIDTGLAIDPVEVNVLDNMQQQNAALAPEIQDMQADASAERDAVAADAAMEREIKKAKSAPSKPSGDK